MRIVMGVAAVRHRHRSRRPQRLHSFCVSDAMTCSGGFRKAELTLQVPKVDGCRALQGRLGKTPDLGTLQLLGRGGRKMLHEGEVAWDLVVGELLRACASDLLRFRWRIREVGHASVQLYKGEDFLASDIVWNRRYRHARDLVEVLQNAFHLDNCDVLATAADDVLLAVHEVERPVWPLAHDIVRCETSRRPMPGPWLQDP